MPTRTEKKPAWEAGARWYRARPWCQALGDALLIHLSVWLAFALRYNTLPPPDGALTGLWPFFLPLALLRLVCLRQFQIYRIHWRFVGVHELKALLAATTVSSLLFYALLVLCQRWDFPRGVLVIDWLLTMFLIGGLRISYRLLLATGRRGVSSTARRILLIGAGIHGEALARELAHRRDTDYRLIGFLDDAPAKQGLMIQGLPVLGSVDAVAEVVTAKHVDEIVIAIPSATGAQIRRIVGLCESLPVRLRISPGFSPGAGAGAAMVRDVSVEDLLRRPPVRINTEEIAGYLTGERVLITGAGGSIGAELCRQVATMKPECLLLLGRGENSIFQVHQELRERAITALPLIADVRDFERMEQIFQMHRPTVVFHAAAHKHVPLMEAHPEEAVTNNILGTRNMVRLAARHGIKRFVLISSDKAVNPTSVMGASKRVAELLVQAAAQEAGEASRFMTVRFGNVLGSRGSVVPTMRRLIEQGRPVKVTHPEMVRYFMTIPEAVSLVLQAGALGSAGEVFMLDMGEPVRIVDLARDLIRLSGLVPEKDIPILFTGLRPGEKLYEELLTASEGATITRHEKIFAAAPVPIDAATLDSRVDALAGCAAEGDAEAIRALLRRIVPTYRDPAPAPLPAYTPAEEEPDEATLLVALPAAPRTRPGATAQV